jgi:hypothetical protein
VGRELDPQRPAELLHGGLADRVGARERAVGERVHRGDHDHLAAAARDLRQGGVHGAIDAEQVDLDHALERLWVHRADRSRRRGDPGVGDDDVEGAEPLHRTGDGRLE